MFTTAAQLLDLTDSEAHYSLLHWYRPWICSGCIPFSKQMKLVTTGRYGLTIPFPEKLLLVLRDGRKLIGVLRSWDQFDYRLEAHKILASNGQAANLVLQDTIERIFVNDLYADIPRGIFLVRGENVLLLGEIDLDKDDYIPEPFRKASAEEVHSLSVARKAERKKGEKVKEKRLGELGFEVEHTGEVLY
ncbi:SM-like, degradation of cytoplasmic mRNAs and positively regulates transcription initiation [Xylographa pallens]|nr:SM-like, degradation of cytoplasmic mRNAs and positively regulates transcription initiation [Xylographa pallens]